MKNCQILCAMVLAAMPAAVLADDPNDPSMRSAEARARDRAIIRRLNQDQLAFVQKRDARQAQGWEAYRHRDADTATYDDQRRAYDRAQQRHAEEMAEYRRRLAAWRRADID